MEPLDRLDPHPLLERLPLLRVVQPAHAPRDELDADLGGPERARARLRERGVKGRDRLVDLFEREGRLAPDAEGPGDIVDEGRPAVRPYFLSVS